MRRRKPVEQDLDSTDESTACDASDEGEDLSDIALTKKLADWTAFLVRLGTAEWPVHEDCVEEIVQETLIAACRNMEGETLLDSKGAVVENEKAWLAKIGRCRSVDFLRKNRLHRQCASLTAACSEEPRDPATTDPAESSEICIAVRHACQRLPADKRQAIADVHFEGLSIVESARQNGLKYQAQAARYRRGLADLRSQLARFNPNREEEQ